jgi:glycosyltransferase involved in cell wall biosynthesis
MSSSHKNWVLGFLAKELSKNLEHFRTRIIPFPQSRRNARSLRGFLVFPKSEVNIFLHHELALTAISKGWLDSRSFNLIIMTHLTTEDARLSELKSYFRLIIVNNSQTKKYLCGIGFDEDLIHVFQNPIDEKFRVVQTREGRKRDVIFVSNYTPRKRPDLIAKVVQESPEINFTLFGRGWAGQTELTQIIDLPNFIFSEFNFESYPQTLGKHKVFCSLSDIEGGPVPLLEALVMGLNVVATDTGSARDLIIGTDYSRIIPINPDIDVIKESLNQSLEGFPNSFIVRDSYFYAGFTQQIQELILRYWPRVQ